MLNHVKKFILFIIIFLLFNVKEFRYFMLLIILTLIILETLVFVNWFYKFYYCYSTNTYLCLNLKDIYYESIDISLWNHLLLYIKISLFKKLRIVISKKKKKKKFSIVTIFYLLIIWSLNIPIKSIRLIYEILFFFNIKIFINSIKNKELKLYFNDLTRKICYRFCQEELVTENTKIELFNKNLYC